MNVNKKKSKGAKWIDWFLKNSRCKRKMTRIELTDKKWTPLTND